MITAFSLSQTRERLSAFAAATTMTLVVMAGITTLAQPERAEGQLQAQALPVVELPVQRVVVTPVQQVHVTSQRLPRT
jgi:hypothetical protein